MKIKNNTYSKNKKPSKRFDYNNYTESECYLKYSKIIRNKFKNISELKLMEIEAKHGHNLNCFNDIGLLWHNIHANNVSPEKRFFLKESLPNATIHSYDTFDLGYRNYFDVVFQSMVFTSELSTERQKRLANTMFKMTKKGGIILWHDFMSDQPNNKNVKGISKNEIAYFFPYASKIDYYRITLTPPLGKLVGKLYPIINTLFTPFRTHLIAIIHKN
jgi:hypothetical protein